jgi:hypothetical protein
MYLDEIDNPKNVPPLFLYIYNIIICYIAEGKEECSKIPWCIFDNREKHCYWKEDWCNNDHLSKFNFFT